MGRMIHHWENMGSENIAKREEEAPKAFASINSFGTKFNIDATKNPAYLARRYDDAIESVKGWSNPPGFMLALIAAAHAQLDHMDEARATRQQFERGWPDDRSISALARAFARQCARQEDHDHWLEGFRKAGFEV